MTKALKGNNKRRVKEDVAPGECYLTPRWPVDWLLERWTPMGDIICDPCACGFKGVSIGDLMFAGLIPVFWIMVCMLVTAYWQAVKYGYPKRADGSTMYRTAAGDFFLYPTQGVYPGWLLLNSAGGPVMRRCKRHPSAQMKASPIRMPRTPSVRAVA